jgi:hypothetical protein
MTQKMLAFARHKPRYRLPATPAHNRVSQAQAQIVNFQPLVTLFGLTRNILCPIISGYVKAHRNLSTRQQSSGAATPTKSGESVLRTSNRVNTRTVT